MKGFVLLAFLAFGCVNNSMVADHPVKAILVFRGLKNLNGKYQLWFQDKKNKSYYFNPQRSNTEPYVFFSTSADGSLKENEKIRGSWFFVSYTQLNPNKTVEKIITKLKEYKDTK